MTPALLCESCGYEIAGLPGESRCPECGRPVASSLPDQRPGSPWQQQPSPRSLLATNYRAIRDARSLYDMVRVDSGVGLAGCNLLLAAIFLVAPWAGVLIGDPVRRAAPGRHGIPAALWSIPTQIALVALFLLVLTLIEWTGIQLLARTRSWRLTPEAAWQVCAHATVGWVITAVTSWLGLIAWLNLSSLGLMPGGPVGQAAQWAVPLAGALFGLLIFELLVWTGARRCKYANPPSARARPAASRG